MPPRRTLDATNDLYRPLQEVEIGGHAFQVYGSMSWTVAEVRKTPLDVILRAYVALTGDARPNVNQDTAMNVIAGELQFTWARLKGREDLLPVLEANQKKRIEDALVSVQKVKGERKGRPTSGRSTSRSTGDNMSTTNGEATTADAAAAATGDVAAGTTEPASNDKTPRSLPTRGSMGKAREVIESGERDLAKVCAAVQEAFPNIKNVQRHVQYVASLLRVKLSKPATVAAPAAPAAAPAEEPATVGV